MNLVLLITKVARSEAIRVLQNFRQPEQGAFLDDGEHLIYHLMVEVYIM